MSLKFPDVGPLEMKVLGILEGGNPQNVTEIQSALKKTTRQEHAYTTVMTILVRLFQKGYLKREKTGRQFFYSLADQKGNASQKLFERVKRSLFMNQRLKPILALLDSESDLTTEELKELRKVVEDKIKQAKS